MNFRSAKEEPKIGKWYCFFNTGGGEYGPQVWSLYLAIFSPTHKRYSGDAWWKGNSKGIRFGITILYGDHSALALRVSNRGTWKFYTIIPTIRFGFL